MFKLGSFSLVLGLVVGTACVPDAAGGRDLDEVTDSAELADRRAPESIQSVVRAHFGEFRACYEDALERDPELEGKVVLAFTIDRDGTTLDPKAGQGTTISDKALQTCMIDAAADLEFEAAAVTTTVGYPIAFSPG